jgi:hypothetical protein
MSVIRVGSTSKYADGWDAVFGRARPGKAVSAKPGKKATPAKQAAAKAKKTSAGTKKKLVTKARKPGRKRRG